MDLDLDTGFPVFSRPPPDSDDASLISREATNSASRPTAEAILKIVSSSYKRIAMLSSFLLDGARE